MNRRTVSKSSVILSNHCADLSPWTWSKAYVVLLVQLHYKCLQTMILFSLDSLTSNQKAAGLTCVYVSHQADRESIKQTCETIPSTPSPQWSSSCYAAAPTPPFTAPSLSLKQWCCVVPTLLTDTFNLLPLTVQMTLSGTSHRTGADPRRRLLNQIKCFTRLPG